MYYNKRVSISVLIIWTVIEPVRLYYGFAGNLKETVRNCLYEVIDWISAVGSRPSNVSPDKLVPSATICNLFGLCSTCEVSCRSHNRNFYVVILGKHSSIAVITCSRFVSDLPIWVWLSHHETNHQKPDGSVCSFVWEWWWRLSLAICSSL